jgi:phosphatidylserine/phosphatidylglycerophosphate/cardiolipin synthase-like enzyme
VRLDGEIVERSSVKFFESFWFRESVEVVLQPSSEQLNIEDHDLEAGYVAVNPSSSAIATPTLTGNHLDLPRKITLQIEQPIRTLFLPSRHHRNPQFRPFHWQASPSPPRTPLNSFILHLLDNATTSISLQTPNVTSPPVLASLSNALARGVSVSIVTNERLMFWEQVVTAGTTTPACLNMLIARHQKLKAETIERQGLYQRQNSLPPGSLKVSYFSSEAGIEDAQNMVPVSSHLKMTVVDGEVVILGSGNMDRASWYTSQELGVAFESREMVEVVMKEVERVDNRCCKVVYDA